MRFSEIFGPIRCLIFALVLVDGVPSGAGAAEPVDPTTLDGKMIMGYQGWFACPGDAARRGWVHWKINQRQVSVDLLPDVSELPASERCDSGYVAKNGGPVSFFSDQNPATVDRQFAWMETYGIDGVALQRFASQLLRPETAVAVDRVLANVRQGAERHGRVLFLMYDLSGLKTDRLSFLVDDWRRLVERGYTSSRAYLRHKGHPVLALWGLGFAGRNLSPAQIDDLLSQLRDASGTDGVTFLGGVPAGWREGERDASPDPAWRKIWPRLGVISPWTVGRYRDDKGADDYRARMLAPDLAAAREMGVDYMPVVFPGFSWSNLMRARHRPEKSIFNETPRRCGAFYWRQVANAIEAGARMLYTAMFDEVDEGTAMFKLDPDASESPAEPSFVTLDVDGCHVPSDWYLQLGGAAQSALTAGRASFEMPLKMP